MDARQPADDGGLLRVLGRAQRLGWLGRAPVEEQLAHARAYAPLVPSTGTVVDLGTGGGVPALVLAVDRPEREMVMVERSQKRADHLSAAVLSLGLGDRCEVVVASADEVVTHRPDLHGGASAVTARSFAPPPVVAEVARPYLDVGGVVVVSEPPSGPERWPAEPLARLGLEVSARRTDPGLVQLRCVAEAELPLPRPPGRPWRTPLWPV